MKLYAVFFGVKHEGSGLEGVFSTQEKAIEQIEICKVIHGGFRARKGQQWEWYPDSDHHTWVLGDLHLQIVELELDYLAYENQVPK